MLNKWLFIAIGALLLAAVANNFYTFYFQKDYVFEIEAPCDSSVSSCFIRDCSDGECPPSELEQYRVFEISAADFAGCEDNSCASACSIGSISCEEIVCGESEEDTCVYQGTLE